jgi:hypothetical protein
MDVYATTQVTPGPLGNAVLVLQEKSCGIVRRVKGGAVGAAVVEERIPGSLAVRKHVGRPEREDFSLDFGFAMERPIFDWIAGTWNLQAPRLNGAIVACDLNRQPKTQRKFSGALLTETTVPGLDTSSNDPAWLNLKFAVESVRLEAASGGKATGDPMHPEKLLQRSHFKLEIEGLDCSKVMAIDPFTVRQILLRAGGKILVPGSVAFPNLRITFAEVSADSWQQWLEDFVVAGNHSGDNEKRGSLTLLSRDRKQTLATIQFHGLGIFNLSHAAMDNPRHDMLATAQLYCQSMEFKPGT